MPPNVRPRGPLPARVYWTRRAVVLAVPLLLVVVLARVLGGSADGEGERNDQAATVSSSAETPAPSVGPTAPAGGKKGKKGKRQKPVEPVLAEPSGECEESDIIATPAVETVPGGSDVPITINLRTRESEACTWTVSPETFTVTITSGSDHIWSSRECPTSVPSQEVVVRQAVDAPVAVTWHARRSDENCSRFTDWARPGYYHVQSAALGGDATDVQFRLVPPEPAVITKTVDPPKDGKKNKNKKNKKGKKRKNQPRDFKPGQDGEGNPNG